jgi:hypothetical protein
MRTFLGSIALGSILAFSVSGCVGTAQTQTSLTEAEFREEVVGARLVWGMGETRFFENGTFSGTSGKEVLKGRWEFKNGEYCRSGSIGGRPFPYACESVTLSGNTLTFRGANGEKFIYTIVR